MKKVFLFTVILFAALQLFASRMDEGRTDYAYIRSAEASSTYSEWLSGKEVIYDALNVLDGTEYEILDASKVFVDPYEWYRP